MLYDRSPEIETQLDTVLRLIRTGRYSTPKLPKRLGVSIPTVSRCVAALRARRHDSRAENHGPGWRCVLVRPPKAANTAEPRHRAGATQ